MVVDTWKYLNVISQIIEEGVILPNGWYTRQYSECDQSDYTRGDNRGRADLQRGGQARVSRLKFPLKDREPRWQGSTTFSDSCLFMISNLVNPLFHCNSQYSWYKGLKAIGVTGRRKKLTRTFPEPWSRSNAFSQMWASDRRKGFPYGTCQSCIPLVLVPLSWYLVQGNSESDEYGSRSQDMMVRGLTRCHQVTTRLAQACQPLVYNRAGGRDTNLIKIISPQQNTSYTSMEAFEPPLIILRKRTQYSSSWKGLKT